MAKKQVEEFVIEDGVLLRYNGRSKVVTIPDKVVEIGAGAFVKKIKVFGVDFTCVGYRYHSRRIKFFKMLSKLISRIFGTKQINISDNVVIIADSAFEDCISLKAVKFSKNLEQIGACAFKNCENLKEVIFDKDCPLAYIGSSAFCNCKKLKSVQLPDNLHSIEEGAFSSCRRLKAIELPDSVFYIGPGAFGGCKNLEYIYKSDNSQLFTICTRAFRGCKLRQFEVTKKMAIIGAGAFSDNKKIKEFTVPKHIVFYGEEMFKGCKKFKYLYFENKGSWISYDNGDRVILSGTPKETARQKIATIFKEPSDDRDRGTYSITNLSSLVMVCSTGDLLENRFRYNVDVYHPANCYVKYEYRLANRYNDVLRLAEAIDLFYCNDDRFNDSIDSSEDVDECCSIDEMFNSLIDTSEDVECICSIDDGANNLIESAKDAEDLCNDDDQSDSVIDTTEDVESYKNN